MLYLSDCLLTTKLEVELWFYWDPAFLEFLPTMFSLWEHIMCTFTPSSRRGVPQTLLSELEPRQENLGTSPQLEPLVRKLEMTCTSTNREMAKL